jgi:hypothetical protein
VTAPITAFVRAHYRQLRAVRQTAGPIMSALERQYR